MKYNNDRYYEPEDDDFSNWYEALGQLEIEEDYEPNTAPQDVIDKVKSYWREIAEEFTEGDF